LNKYSKKIYKKTKNLITGDTEKDADYQQKADNNIIELLSYWHPNLTINLIDDHTPWQKNAVPPPINECRS
jgi:aspartate carbamoyltransferase regulatory subunit